MLLFVVFPEKVCFPILCFENKLQSGIIGNSSRNIATKGLVIVCSSSTHHYTSAGFQPLLVRFKMGFQLEKHLNMDTMMH